MKTSLYSILCIAIRVGAVWLGFQTVMTAISGVRDAHSTANADLLLATIISAAFGFALAAVLWLWPGAIARMAVRNSALEVFESPIGAAEIHYIAMSLLGVAFAFDGVVRLSHEAFFAFGVGATRDMSFAQALKYELGDVLTSASRVVLGGALVLGARGLVGGLRSMRERGLPPALRDAPVEDTSPGRG